MTRLAGLLVILSFHFASAQLPDSADHFTSPPDSLPNFYSTGKNDWLPLYNGRQFYAYPFITKGEAFYPNTEWHTGTIVFDGVLYSGIDMLYDAFKDEVVVRHPANLPIILFSERVREMSFDSNYFFYVRADNEDQLKKGFYEQLLIGKATLLSKRVRLYQEATVGTELEREFLVADEYYILKDGKYHRINSKKKLFELLKDKRKALMGKARQLRLRYRKDKENFLKTITGYYNQLSS